jgi:hypothetical protein
MKTKIIAVAMAIVALVGFGTMFVTAKPVAATETCPYGLFCGFDGDNLNGTRWLISFSMYNGGPCLRLTTQGPYTVGTGDNAWNSAYNNFGNGYAAKVYKSINCTNPHIQIGPQNASYFSADWDNVISSFHIIPH